MVTQLDMQELLDPEANEERNNMSPKESEIEVVYRGYIDETLELKIINQFHYIGYEKIMDNYDYLDKRKTILFRKS